MTAEERAEFERWEASLPEGEDDMTPEQRAELASIVAQYEAGTLPMVAHDDVPAFLEQMARERTAAA
jgi:Leu/Phe-tRNA-protein transferase